MKEVSSALCSIFNRHVRVLLLFEYVSNRVVGIVRLVIATTLKVCWPSVLPRIVSKQSPSDDYNNTQPKHRKSIVTWKQYKI